jgi:hypothetical protein
MPDYVTETGRGVACAHWNDYPMPNTFKCFQGIAATAGRKFNRNQNVLLNTRILDKPIITNENNIKKNSP